VDLSGYARKVGRNNGLNAGIDISEITKVDLSGFAEKLLISIGDHREKFKLRCFEHWS